MRPKWISQHNFMLPILPVVFFLLVFFVFPIWRVIYGSFWDPDFTLKNYIHFFREPVYVKVVLNTFKISLSVTLFSLLLGYPYAYLMANTSDRIAAKMMIFVLLPWLVSILVRCYAWMIILGRNGVINSSLLNVGLISSPIKLLYNTTAVNIGMVHVMLPYMILSLYSVMKGIDRDLLKAAESLGAGRFQAFMRIFFPLSLPGVGGGCLIVFIMSIGFFITPALLGGSGDTMIAQLIESNVRVLLRWSFAFASSIVLLLSTVFILVIYNRFLGLDRLWGEQQ